MLEKLLRKLKLNEYYSNYEIDYLLKNIGNEDCKIRDDIVYSSFCNAILIENISLDQLKYIFNYLVKNNLLFVNIGSFDMKTLTRSFTTLILSLIIYVDNQKDSRFYNVLTENERNYVFNNSLEYIKQECDLRGYSKELGWIHSFAHASDLIMNVVNHSKFNIIKIQSVFNVLIDKISNVDAVFTAGEDFRLANIFCSLISIDKISQFELVKWITEINFHYDSDEKYLSKINVHHFVMHIYFGLKKMNKLSQNNEKLIIDKLFEFN